MRVRFADLDDLSAIREIWRASFPQDTSAERDDFLRCVDLSTECMVAEVGGSVQSMGFFLPATFSDDTQTRSLRYLYAASTLPTARGKGLFSLVFKTASDAFRSTTDAIYLKPATPSLVAYYERLGCIPMMFGQRRIDKASPSSLSVQPVSAETYLEKRRRLARGRRIVLDERFIRYEARQCVALSVDGVACGLVVNAGGKADIVDMVGETTPTVCSAFAQFCGCQEYRITVPSEIGICQGMVLPLDESARYLSAPLNMGLTMD